MAADIGTIFMHRTGGAAEYVLEKSFQRYEQTAPALVRWTEGDFPEGFTTFALRASHRRKPCITNLLDS